MADVAGAVAVAHRGDPYRVRENTLPSLRSALRQGARTWWRSTYGSPATGLPMLLHDATLDRLWGRQLRLAQLTAQEVRELTGGVPTLGEALAAICARSTVRPLLDFPDPAAVPAAVAAVRESGAADRAYYCGGATAMLAVRAQDPGAEIALTWTTLAPPRPALPAAVRPRWLGYRFGLLAAELVARLHADGLLVPAWTPDTRRSMSRLLRHGRLDHHQPHRPPAPSPAPLMSRTACAPAGWQGRGTRGPEGQASRDVITCLMRV